jgi:hypothetical protein
MTEQTPRQSADKGDLSTEAVHTILGTARFGVRAYPGPVGELIDRELRAYVDTGRQLPPHAIPERLLTTLHQAQEREPATAAEPEATLPVRYRKGTPLHWEPTPRAESS